MQSTNTPPSLEEPAPNKPPSLEELPPPPATGMQGLSPVRRERKYHSQINEPGHVEGAAWGGGHGLRG